VRSGLAQSVIQLVMVVLGWFIGLTTVLMSIPAFRENKPEYGTAMLFCGSALAAVSLLARHRLGRER
jgi:uncharacterized membrane protein